MQEKKENLTKKLSIINAYINFVIIQVSNSRALEEYIKEKEDTKYNVTIEHDENTGLVKYVIMTPVEKN